ncbi:MAG: HD-GYP domain-containing protein, partial [Pyrinomonadaceae bacterium]
MRDEALLEMPGAATVRLVNDSWVTYLQQACARLKALGAKHSADGTHYLVKRLKRTRPSTYFHSLRVASLARATGQAYGFDGSQMRQLSATAMMHDIGKILVPERILNRPRRPTRFERFVLHLHPNLGALLASYFNLTPELRIRTQHHHE